MKINNSSTLGFWLWSPSSQYEDGDFVVHRNIIYVCSPKSGTGSIEGVEPSQSPDFYVYLGDRMTGVSDFLEFSENGGGQDKYISLASLPGILNTYMKGLDTSGVIGDSVTLSDSGQLIIRVSDLGSLVNFDASSVLADIMLSTIDNGIMKVSRGLPEIQAYTGISSEYPYCILRQYTYYDALDALDRKKVRVQELIDHSSGDIFYRTAVLGEMTVGQILSSGWKIATVHKDLTRKAENLFRTYSARMKGFEIALEELHQNFSFARIRLPEESEIKELVLQDSNPDQAGYVKSLVELGPVTLNILTTLESGAYQSNTVTLEPSFGTSNYYITDDLSVYLEVNGQPEEKPEEEKFIDIKIRNKTGFDLPIRRGWSSLGDEKDFDISDTISTGDRDCTLSILDSKSSTDFRNSISLDVDALVKNSVAVVLKYTYFSESGEIISGPHIGFFKKDGLTEDIPVEFDLSRGKPQFIPDSYDEPCRYLFSGAIDNLQDGGYIDIEVPSVEVKDEESFIFSIENNLDTLIYYSAPNEVRQEQSLRSKEKRSGLKGYQGKTDRGVYFKGITKPAHIKLYAITDPNTNTEKLLGTKNIGLGGEYINPIATFSEIWDIIDHEECWWYDIVIRVEDGELEEEKWPIIEETTTTTTTLPPGNVIPKSIVSESVKISLRGAGSKIASAYYRRFYGN